MKILLVQYPTYKTPVQRPVIQTLEDYIEFEESGMPFFHEPIKVLKLIQEGKTIVVNPMGGWCWVCDDVKIVGEINES